MFDHENYSFLKMVITKMKLFYTKIFIGYLIVIHKAAVHLATFVAFLIGVDRRILITRRGFSPLTHSLISS